VPIDNLDDAFDALSNQLENELTPIVNLLEDNYIGRPGRYNRRSHPALFPPEIWSMYVPAHNKRHWQNKRPRRSSPSTPEKITWRCPSLNLEVHRWSAPCSKGER